MMRRVVRDLVVFAVGVICFGVAAYGQEYIYPTTGSNGSAPDTDYYALETSTGTVNIQSNRICFTPAAGESRARLKLLDGAGGNLSLSNVTIEFDAFYATTMNSSNATLIVVARQQDHTAWANTAWNNYALPANGNYVWGWNFGFPNDLLEMGEVISSTGAALDDDESLNVAAGNTYHYRFTLNGTSLEADRYNTSGGSAGTLVSATDASFSSGYLAIGYGAGAGSNPGQVCFSNLTVDDLDTAAGPEVDSVTPSTFEDTDTGIVIAGSSFAATGNSVLICPTDDVEDMDCEAQTITAEDADEITFTAVQGSNVSDMTAYLFVIDDAMASNADGFEVQFSSGGSAVPAALHLQRLMNAN